MTHDIRRSLPAAIVLLAAFAASAAQAQSVRVRCDSSGDRSRASVDGRDLSSGDYTARLESGSHVKDSKNSQTAVNGEAEFDFDSDRGDIHEGATKINRQFIQNSSVTGSILDAGGNVVAHDTAKCKGN